MRRHSRHVPLTFSECESLWERTRNYVAGKPLANNTRLYRRQGSHAPGGYYFAVCFHSTDVVEIYANGTFGVRTNGWTTLTTKQRITSYAPIGWDQIIGKMGDDDGWHLRTRPASTDPEPPERNSIEVTKPYPQPAQPGTEPQSEDYGRCIAGTVEEYSYEDTVYDFQVSDEARERLHPHANSYSPCWSVAANGIIAYGEDSYRYVREPGIEYKQCPHCKAHKADHARWSSAKRRWDTYVEHVEHYGSYEGWRAGWSEDRHRVVLANRAWRAWDERNRIALDGLVRINAEGFPLWSEVKAVRSAQWAAKRREIRARREREARERERRAVERYKASIRRRRKPTFEQRAAEVAAELAAMADGVRVTISTNESQEITA